MANDPLDEAFQHVDPTKRDFLKALLVGTAFAAPMIVSFSMDGLSVHEAYAQGSNIGDSQGDEDEDDQD